MSTPHTTSPQIASKRTAVLDELHIGDIEGALGTIKQHDNGRRTTWWARFRTLMAIVGPGLIVMVGDNDAGAFGTYTQAGQNYGTTLLWTLLLLIPVLYVNQEMVLRLGAVSGVGHARLIFERFGKFWGVFSVIDLFALNALTMVTEFVGVDFVLDFFGFSKIAGVCIAAALIMIAVSTGSFRRFERFAVVLCVGSLLLIPVLLNVHPPVGQVARDFFIPNWPAHSNLSDVMLLIIGIVGTTVAPWQLFFQQSYVVDKRITPRFIKYERADLCIGIMIVMLGAVAMVSIGAALFAGKPEFGNFTDTEGFIRGLAKYAGHTSAVLFAVALFDACLIGAASESLAASYAIADVFSLKHSLHRKPSDAKGFYFVYFAIVAAAAALVLVPGTPLGLLTLAVQTLAGIVLPSATVFLLLLCNDKAVLGPWVNSKPMNVFTGAIIWVLVMLSIILTTSVVFPDIGSNVIIGILGGGSALAALVYLTTVLVGTRKRSAANAVEVRVYSKEEREAWRMAPLAELPAPTLTLAKRFWMGVLRGYLLVAIVLFIVKLAQMTFFK
ncbi:NRAMP family divalent metal transporter [Paraburkholderia humisilvae]|uniref:Divalent metal cation transporter MntH n=1 Tax=Paraburkholderia humisilvae TaxID=627669 RepID=A0A6J5D4V5_9BURK|nr:NRAMP family divalent metal transporter [Paraburkholderia humisilvae]CAB3748441.1 Divalent metal cation transporter MntH [Paraburkholderia humisilvae]